MIGVVPLTDVMDRFLEAAAANHKERVLAPIMAALQRQAARVFRVQGQRFLRAFAALRSRFVESVALRESLTSDDWLRLFDEATGATTELFFGAIQDAARAAMSLGAQNAIASVGVDIAFNLRNPRAEAYLQAHGYGLISNIDSVTRGSIATIIGEAMRTGQSYNETAKEITALYSQMAVGKPQQHIDSRAHLIAVTEAGMAYEAGNAFVVQDLQDAGLRMEKKWLTVGDDRVSAGCRANEAEGWIPLAQAHRSGHQQPLRFPGCRCTELYQRARAATSAPPPVEFEPVVQPPALGDLGAVVQAQDVEAQRLIDLATETINKVHQLPTGLSSVPVYVRPLDGSRNGAYVIDWRLIGPQHIEIDAASQRQEFTFLHEFGHYLDHQVLGLSNELGRMTREAGAITGIDAQLQSRFWQTVKATPAIADMERRLSELRAARPLLGDGGVKTPEERVLDYYLQEAEIWARSYSQWVATRANRLGYDVAVRSAQWQDADEFAPVARVIDDIFSELGLMP